MSRRGNLVVIVLVFVLVAVIFVGVVLYIYARESPDYVVGGNSSAFLLLSSGVSDRLSYVVYDVNGSVLMSGVLFPNNFEVVRNLSVNDSVSVLTSGSGYYGSLTNCFLNVSGENRCLVNVTRKAGFVNVSLRGDELYVSVGDGVLRNVYFCFVYDYRVWGVSMDGVDRVGDLRSRFGYSYDVCFHKFLVGGDWWFPVSFKRSPLYSGGLVSLFVFDDDDDGVSFFNYSQNLSLE